MEYCLRVEAALTETSVVAGSPCGLSVQIVNVSGEAALVNRRMSMGYRNSLSRELFVDLIDLGTGAPPVMKEVDYERQFPARDDFVVLQPGEKISAEFNLFDWYAPVTKGKFRIVIHYQADEPLARAPDGVVQGVFTGAPLELTVK